MTNQSQITPTEPSVIHEAKIESFEKQHFNALHKIEDKSSFDSVIYSKDLAGHSDRRMYVNGIGQLGDVSGKTVLLYGCGIAVESYFIVQSARKLIGFDIAFNSVRRAQFGAEKYGFTSKASYTTMSGYLLGIKTNSIDCIYGHAILHHLDLDKAGKELYRILKPGGIAVFAEPLDTNPILRFARQRLPYPHKHRLKDEKGITYKDLKKLEQYFSFRQYYEWELLLMIGRVINNEFLKRVLEKADAVILALFPFLKPLCRLIYVKYRK